MNYFFLVGVNGYVSNICLIYSANLYVTIILKNLTILDL